jgi:hypothetical protein
MVCFSVERIREPMDVPTICGNGHLLTSDNLRVDEVERRWRCRSCARERATKFRVRHKRAA